MLSVIDIYNFFICCKANLFIIGNAKQVEFTVLLIKMFLNTNAGLFLLLLFDCEYLFILKLWKKTGKLVWGYRHSCQKKVTSEIFVHFSENHLQVWCSTGPVRNVLVTSINWFCTDLLNLKFSSIFLSQKIKTCSLLPLYEKRAPLFATCYFCSGNKVEKGKVMRWKVKTFVKSENIFSCLEDDLKMNGKMNIFQVLKNISR